MKIIIELDSRTEQQPEVRKVSTPVAEQQYINTTDSSIVSASTPIDAGHARIPEGYNTEASGLTTAETFQGSSGSTGGALNAGTARVQEDNTPAAAMPDTGNMETYNTGNAFSAGALVTPGSN